jgi:CDP-glucose 4,6-dehydratase
MIKLNSRFWVNKKILVTGHTGFTGTWLVHILLLLGCKVYGVSLHKNFNLSIFKKSNAEIKEGFFDVCDKKKNK